MKFQPSVAVGTPVVIIRKSFTRSPSTSTPLRMVHTGTRLEAVDSRQPFLDSVKSSELRVQGQCLGFLGELSAAGLQQAGLRSPATVAEIRMPVLVELANLIPKYAEQSPYPAIERDLNLIVDEAVRWASLAETVQQSVGECLESLRYQEIYRDPKKDGTGKKRLLFSITLRSRQRTLTNEEADQIRQHIVDACHQSHGAVLLGVLA